MSDVLSVHYLSCTICVAGFLMRALVTQCTHFLFGRLIGQISLLGVASRLPHCTAKLYFNLLFKCT